jgi:hypothetical protein
MLQRPKDLSNDLLSGLCHFRIANPNLIICNLLQLSTEYTDLKRSTMVIVNHRQARHGDARAEPDSRPSSAGTRGYLASMRARRTKVSARGQPSFRQCGMINSFARRCVGVGISTLDSRDWSRKKSACRESLSSLVLSPLRTEAPVFASQASGFLFTNNHDPNTKGERLTW